MKHKNYNDEQLRDLLNASIDGELNVSEQNEVDSRLAASEKVRDLHAELKSFVVLLNELPEREPPTYLLNTIESQLRLPAQSHQREVELGAGEKSGWLNAWIPTNWLGTGLALAAGVILTVGIYQTGSDFPAEINTSDMTGTIVQSPETQAGILLDLVDFKSAALESVIELRERSGLLIVDVQFVSIGAAALQINFAGRGLEYAGLEQLQSQSNAVSIEKGSIHVASGGEQHYRLLLRPTSKPPGQQLTSLGLEFFADNKLVHSAELSLVQ